MRYQTVPLFWSGIAARAQNAPLKMLREFSVRDISPAVGAGAAARLDMHNGRHLMAAAVAHVIAMHDGTILDNGAC